MNQEELTNELMLHFKAKTPCIWINSLEEKRTEQIILSAFRSVYPGYSAYYWSCGLGGHKINILNGADTQGATIKQRNDMFYSAEELEQSIGVEDLPPSPAAFLKTIPKLCPSLVIARDFPDFQRMLTEQRMVRDIYERGSGNEYKPFVVISTTRNVPLMLQKLFVSLDLDLMKSDEILPIINKFCEVHDIQMDSKQKTETAKASCGLTKFELGQILNYSMKKTSTLDTQLIAAQKTQIIKKSDVLTYLEPRKSLDDIGGHAALKEWIKSVKACMTPEAEEFGVQAAKGFIAMGQAGTGKSLVAEAIADYFNTPLVIFDLSRIMGGLVGESETTARRAFETLKSIGPCVVLIDECDKQFGNGGLGRSSQADAGTMGRVFGVVLQNLQENTGQFYILTANDISNLPGPLTRSGRLDTKWYFDFPNSNDRKDIFNIYLNKTHKVIPDKLLDYAIKLTENYTGAEIETAVNNMNRYAFFRKMKDNNPNLTKEDILKGIRDVSTVFKTNSAEITSLKTYASQNQIRSTNALVYSAIGDTGVEADDFISNYLSNTGG